MSELEEIKKRYERRRHIPVNLYSRFNDDVLAAAQERQRALVHLLKMSGIRDLSDISVLEVGCGSGANILELLGLGARPQNLVGNELIPDRVNRARSVLPQSIHLIPGDATRLTVEPNSFDFVYQSTVFSSILDDDLQIRLAELMWQWAKPGGGILWYDFVCDNPGNQDVRGVPIRRVKELFPDAQFICRRVTLAPPISRRVCKLSPVFYTLINSIPILRTHIFCLILKKRTGIDDHSAPAERLAP